MFFKFPYTDMYALNLDWIIKQMNDYIEYLEQLKAELPSSEDISYISENIPAIKEVIENIDRLVTSVNGQHGAVDLGTLVNSINGMHGDVTLDNDFVNGMKIEVVLQSTDPISSFTARQITQLFDSGIRFIIVNNSEFYTINPDGTYVQFNPTTPGPALGNLVVFTTVEPTISDAANYYDQGYRFIQSTVSSIKRLWAIEKVGNSALLYDLDTYKGANIFNEIDAGISIEDYSLETLQNLYKSGLRILFQDTAIGISKFYALIGNELTGYERYIEFNSSEVTEIGNLIAFTNTVPTPSTATPLYNQGYRFIQSTVDDIKRLWALEKTESIVTPHDLDVYKGANISNEIDIGDSIEDYSIETLKDIYESGQRILFQNTENGITKLYALIGGANGYERYITFDPVEYYTDSWVPEVKDDIDYIKANSADLIYVKDYIKNDCNVQNEFYDLSLYTQIQNYINSHLIQGVYNQSSHEYESTALRITGSFILFNKNDYQLTAKSGFLFSRVILNSNSPDDVSGATDWGQGWYMKRNTYYIINVRKSDNTAITPNAEPFVVEFTRRYNNPIDIAINNGATVKAIAHRGYMSEAPENTMPAFKLAVKRGFRYIESDVDFTSDKIPVMIHDTTIDRTSNGTGKVSDMTYQQLLQYDFGSWFNSSFTGTKIPTFREYIHFCKQAQCIPHIEIKTNQTVTEEMLDNLIDIVKDEGMIDNVIWTSYGHGYLRMLRTKLQNCKIGYLLGMQSIDDSIEMINQYMQGAFLQTLANDATQENINKLKNANIPLYVATRETIPAILAENPYVTGILSGTVVASTDLYAASAI